MNAGLDNVHLDNLSIIYHCCDIYTFWDFILPILYWVGMMVLLFAVATVGDWWLIALMCFVFFAAAHYTIKSFYRTSHLMQTAFIIKNTAP